MRFGFAAIALMGVLSACGGKQQSDATTNTTVALQDAASTNAIVTPQDADAVPDGNGSEAAVPPTDAWIGKWTGVEGLALDIAKGKGPGTYRLTIDLLDSHNGYEGEADGSVIRFRRGDVIETIRQVPGSETGLKWLADKPNCLMIKPGEGFCRPA